MAGKPYCYALVDPSGEVFYIGKGRGRRMYAHLDYAKKGGLGLKCDRIRAILAAGGDVEHRVLGEYETDAEALQAECRLIAAHTGLTNLTAGGEGGGLPPKERIRRRARRLLGEMLPLGEWLARGRPTAVGWGLIKMDGGPVAAYERMRAELEAEIANPSPNVLWVAQDGTARLGWE